MFFFVSDSDNINIFNYDRKTFEYRNPYRKGRLIINPNDTITPDQRILGGYNILNPNRVHIIDVRCVFDNTLVEVTLSVPVKYKSDPILLLTNEKGEISRLLRNKIVVQDGLSQFGLMIYFTLKITKQTPGQPEKQEFLYVNSHRYIITEEELEIILDIIINWYNDRLDRLLQRTIGSGWVLDSIELFKICYHQAHGRMRTGAPLVEYPTMRGKTLVFNPPAEDEYDNKCLERCIAAFMISETLYSNAPTVRWNHITNLLKNGENIKNYFECGNIDNVYFDNLNQIEVLNKIKINCYLLYKEAGDDRFNIRLLKRGNTKFLNRDCNLLFFKYKRDVWHVFLIKRPISRYLKNLLQIKLRNESEKICNYCFHVLPNSNLLKDHKSKYCSNRSLNTIIEYPKPNEYLKFRNFKNCQKCDYIGFFDFECSFLDQGNGQKIHIPVIYSLIIVNTRLNIICDYFSYRGSDGYDTVEDFLTRILIFWDKNKPRTSEQFPIHMSLEQQIAHENSTRCASCNRAFDNLIKVAHHCHMEEYANYESSLCQRCNLALKTQNKLVLLAHAGSYDISLILKYANSRYKFQVLTQKSNMKYYYATVNRYIQFCDSYQFLKASLSKLCDQYLESNPSLFYFDKIILSKFKINRNDRLYSLLKRGKLFFPYDYVDDNEKLDQTELPTREDFYNNLRDCPISNIDYENTLQIYTLSECANLGQYYQLYCLLDTIMLCEIYLYWRNFLFDTYKLDIASYLTLPSFSFDCMLYSNTINDPGFAIELMSDVHLSNLILENIRGGYVCLNSHHEKLLEASNLLLNENLSTNDKSGSKIGVEVIDSFDINSNYTGAMTEKLPIANFQELPSNEFDSVVHKLHQKNFNFENEDRGYYCYVTLESNCQEVQDRTDSFPFALQNVDVAYNQLGPYTKNKMEVVNKNLTYKRLVGHHFEKTKQLYDAESLQQFLAHGLKIKEIHSIYSFQQESFLKNYMFKNLNFRKNSKSSMESRMYKLMNNAIFGKSLTNVLHYATKTSICTNARDFKRGLCNENFINYHILNDDKVMLISRKKKVRLKYPNYIGFSILEKSQRFIKTCFYDYILKIYDVNNVKLFYTDTDSLYIKYYLWLDEYTECNYFKEKFKIWQRLKDVGILDTSSFPKDHPLFDVKLKGALYALKNECPNYIYGEWIGIAPKVYTFLFIAYHINKIAREIKNKFIVNFGNNSINYLYTDISSAIFEVNCNLLNSLKDLKEFLQNLEIFVESYHLVEIKFHKYIEFFDTSVEEIERRPLASSFYNPTVLEIIRGKKSIHSDVNNVYYFEIDGDFNCHIFKYACNFTYRPCPDRDLLSDAEIFLAKSKTAAGIPSYKLHEISINDYKEALNKNKINVKKIHYKTIQNQRGVMKTLSSEKMALLVRCLKRYFNKIDTSFSFGHYKIPIIFRNNFTHKDNIPSDCESESDLSEGENGEGGTSDNITPVIDIPAVGYRNNIFADREKKCLNKVFTTSISDINFDSDEIDSVIDQISNSIIDNNTASDDESVSINSTLEEVALHPTFHSETSVIINNISSEYSTNYTPPPDSEDEYISGLKKYHKQYINSDGDATSDSDDNINSININKTGISKSKSFKNPYINDEALIDGNDSSESEYESDGNIYDSNFINNNCPESDYLFYLQFD